MKRTTILFAAALCFCLIAGCTAKPAEGSPTQNTAAASPDLAAYTGDWCLKVSEDETLYRMTALTEYYGSTGITVSEIQNGHLKGSIYSISGAPSYRQANVDFEGDITDGTLTASYKDEGWEYSGTIQLTFGTDAIEAVITRDESETQPLWGIPEGQFTFIRPIQTDKVQLSEAETESLTTFLGAVTKNKIQPFAEGSLTDKAIIEFVGLNIGTGTISTDSYGDKVKSGAEITFDASVMNDIATRYFGTEVKTPQSTDSVTYADGSYTVPAVDGVTEYPVLQALLKDNAQEGAYYAIVDYMFQSPEDAAAKLQYQDLIGLEKTQDGGYTIKSIQAVSSPIDLSLLNT